jgi:hypothetical protein
MRWAVTLLFVCGCAEASPDLFPGDRTIPQVQSKNDMFPPVDTFWLQQEVARRNAQLEAEQARPVRRTVSLGYIGDNPLTGGVMNGPQEYGPNRAAYIEQQQQPCACNLR